jgi:pyruvate/2-oxoglutarate dehydrogenase complex dihydrolipoamide acyltransferase (E2) component
VSSSPTETLVDVHMPQMGVSVAEGTIVAWHKHVGDWVEADETLAEVSTDKIDTEIPAPATGRLAEILVDADVTVEVGTPLARIATDARPGEAHASEAAEPQADAAAAPAPAPQTPAPAPARAAPRSTTSTSRR